LTETLLQYVPIIGRVMEPCAGEGKIAQVLDSYGFHVRTVFRNDIDPRFGYDWHDDAADMDAAMWGGQFDWVVTNPPYNQAAAILETAFKHALVGVAFLLRLSFLEPTNTRKAWLQSHQCALSNLLIFGSPRPSFTDDGRTDSATVAWMIWQHDWTGGPSGGTDVRFITGWDGRG
jgi:hypothetical protein